MPRPLKVSRDESLTAAMHLFWTKGYHSTSVDDLQKAIGIQRGSFYFHFKDKRSLFLEVLDHYKVNVVEKRRALVRSCASPKQGIRLYFQILLEHLLSNRPNRGCLNTNSATELGLSDEVISEKLGFGISGWKEFWSEMIEAGKKKAEISQTIETSSHSQLLVALTQGLNVIARVNPDPVFLNGVVHSGLSFLDEL